MLSYNDVVCFRCAVSRFWEQKRTTSIHFNLLRDSIQFKSNTIELTPRPPFAVHFLLFETNRNTVGEGVELQYRLKGYGIPVDLTPLTDSGNIKTMYLKQWLRLRKIIETGITPSGVKTSTVSIIECPGSNDVIFRPGTSMLCHPGNVAFRGLIEAKQNRITVKRAEKEEVALEIIQEVRSTGGRFLMWDNGGGGSELNDIPLISVKISISYRDFKTKVKTLVQQHQQEQQRKQQNLASATNDFLPGGDKKRKRSMIPTFCGTFE